MATLWFSKDGPRPYNQHGPGMPISVAEAEAIFGNEQARYCGPEPPSINPNTPSHSIKNVVLEIAEVDGSSAHFPKAGCYWLVSLRPADAQSKLHAYRAAA